MSISCDQYNPPRVPGVTWFGFQKSEFSSQKTKTNPRLRPSGERKHKHFKDSEIPLVPPLEWLDSSDAAQLALVLPWLERMMGVVNGGCLLIFVDICCCCCCCCCCWAVGLLGCLLVFGFVLLNNSPPVVEHSNRNQHIMFTFYIHDGCSIASHVEVV